MINEAELKAEVGQVCLRTGVKGHLLLYLDDASRVRIIGDIPLSVLGSMVDWSKLAESMLRKVAK